jgi:hypothetical protein
MKDNLPSIISTINELFDTNNVREFLITITNDEFLTLFEVMKDYKYLPNHLTKSISGIGGNVSSFMVNGNIFHFKIHSK